MNIAVIAPTYIPARRANTLQVMKMAQALVALGHHVRLAAPGSPPNAEPNDLWEELARLYGLRHRFAINWLPSYPQLRRYDYGWHAVNWARRWGAQVIYTRLPQAAAIASITGLATILEIHDLPQGTTGPWLFRRFITGSGARRLVVITKALTGDLVEKYNLRRAPAFILIAPDGVDLDRFTGLPAPEAARSQLAVKTGVKLLVDRFTAGYTGHLYPGRGAEILLALAERLPDVNFLIAGGEPGDVARLQADVERKSLQNIILTGFIPNAELPGYQAACDVLLMPYQRRVAASSGGDISRYLSPMKLFEYLACGRPILSSDLPVLREILSPDNALLLPTGDIDAWTNTLESLRQDPENRARLGEKARQEAARHSWQARAERILDGIEETTGSPIVKQEATHV